MTLPIGPYGITENGFLRKPLAAIKESIDNGAKEVFGQNLNTSPQSVEGQMHGIFSSALSEVWEMLEYLHNSFDPTQAFGDRLDRILELLRLPPRAAAIYSGVQITLQGDSGTTVPQGLAVSNTAGTVTVFSTATVIIDQQGFAEVFARPSDSTVVDVAANELTVAVTTVTGLTGVTNTSPAIVGVLEAPAETDAQIRLRLLGVTNGVQQNVAQSNLIKLLRGLPGVVEAVVYVNDVAETDSRGLPSKSYAAVVEGGDDLQIANVLWNNHTLGIASFGNVATTFTDEQGICRKINFSRPRDVIVLMRLSVRYVDSRCGCQPNDLDGLKANLLALLDNRSDCDGFGIGQPLIVSRLYSAFSEIQGLEIVSLTIAKKDYAFTLLCEGEEYDWDQSGFCDSSWPHQIVFTDQSLPIGWNEKAAYLPEGIALTVLDRFNNVVAEDCLPLPDPNKEDKEDGFLGARE